MVNTTKASEGQADEARKTIKVRPTLFIGAGGTGKEVLLRLRRRILNNDWNGNRVSDLAQFPVAAFLYFDLDTAAAKESDKSRQTDILSSKIAFGSGEVIQNRLDHEQYLEALDRYPLIKEWLPRGPLGQLDPRLPGAGQVRPLSRLYFFDKAGDLQGRIKGKADQLRANLNHTKDLSRLGLELHIGQEVRVVVIASTAGGTGSGSFLDMGYLIGSVLPEAQAHLILLMPSGFKGANESRVFANTYAALMELEYCMRGNRYVQKWTETDIGTPPLSPYNEVFLVDTHNMSDNRTSQVEDVYHMVADVLFEDFGSGEFADAKRSVATNQQQFKLLPHRPSLGTELEGAPLAYSRVYSSFGQATLDTRTHARQELKTVQACREMLRIFFQMAEGGKRNLPTPEERSLFMKDHLQLGIRIDDTFPEFLRKKPQPVHAYELDDRLLKADTGSSLLLTLKDSIHKDFDRIRAELSERRDWPEAIKKVVQDHEWQVLGAPGSPQAAEYQRQIEKRRKEIYEKLWTGGLRQQFYKLVDDKHRGGVEYTIALIEQIKDSLENDRTGVIATLTQAKGRYEALADQMENEVYQRGLDHLQETLGWDPLGTKKKQAEIVFERIRDSLSYRLSYHLLAFACGEAAKALTDLSSWLGRKEGLDTQGEPIWTGLVQEFQAGQMAVKETLKLLQEEEARLEDDLRRGHVMYMILSTEEDTDAPFSFDRNEIAQWAEEALQADGGSRELFARLQAEKERDLLIQQLMGVAQQRLGIRREDMPKILDVFLRLPPERQRQTLQDLLTRAMPWIDADIPKHFQPSFNPGQYKAFFAVNRAGDFRERFGSMLTQIIPATGRLQQEYLQIVESGVGGRIVCYVELSGVPLSVLRPLALYWRPPYLKEVREGLPIHNHKDMSRFPHPVVPDPGEIRRMKEDMRLFLEGVALGLVRRRNEEEGRYELEQTRGDWLSIGSERFIRSNGFSGNYKEILRSQVQERADPLAPAQILALSVLFDYLAKEVYAARVEETSQGVEERRPGFIALQAAALSADYLERYQRLGSATTDQDRYRDALEAARDRWTEELASSHNDTDAAEVDKDRARPKRRVRPEFFTRGWLDHWLQAHATLPSEPTPIPGEGDRICANERCRKPLKPGWKVCPYCETPVTGDQRRSHCPQCGEVVEPSWKLCPSCQTRLE